MPPISINYLAALIAAVGTFALGAVWYSPVLFAKPWLKAHGYTPEKLEQMKQGMGRSYALSFVCYLVMAVVVGVFVSWTGASSLGDGLRLGLYIWVGFAATIGLTAWLFSERKFATYVIDAGYQLVYLLLMGMIMASWR
jgi:hypothetical protein